MNSESAQSNRRLFTRWVRATFLGWLLGFVVVIVLALAWDMIGGGAQFMVGVGMGAGVGYMQSRVVGEWADSPRRWLWASIIGMGAPFVLWDLSVLVGFEFVFSLPLSVLMGGLLVGILQWSLLRPHSDRAVGFSAIKFMAISSFQEFLDKGRTFDGAKFRAPNFLQHL